MTSSSEINQDSRASLTLDQSLARLKKAIESRSAGKENIFSQNSETKIEFPWWPEKYRAMPNHLARSSLFAPLARGKRETFDGALMTSRADVQLRYWGKQLNEPDADAWMQAIHLARTHSSGEPIPIKRSRFLSAIGRHCGSTEYEWLHESLMRLSQGMLEIKTSKYAIGKVPIGERPTTKIHRVVHLIDGFDYDDKGETYVLRIDPRIARLFGNREFSLIDWERRFLISKKRDMAKALQRLISASADLTQRYQIEWLKQKLQYTSPSHKFVEAVLAASKELERVGIIAQSGIEKSSKGKPQLVLTRLFTAR